MGGTGSTCLCFPDVGFLVVCHHAWLFYVGPRDPNSASQAFLPTEFSSQPTNAVAAAVAAAFFFACSREGIRNFYGLE